ncbi:hypothetical protein [Paenibacillus elgii]|uniref:hypothetical protein n=1 Tax=Paenibacillus elgii TaxID=189691 RepID=UPI00203EBF38|nr:hypothetical protein [Paenibacillus elgii]MCM3267677.1 hypothetical protein [Paenibacillus elgii]
MGEKAKKLTGPRGPDQLPGKSAGGNTGVQRSRDSHVPRALEGRGTESPASSGEQPERH